MSELSADSIRVVHPLFQEEGDGAIPISALQLMIGRIPSERAAALNRLWHSRMPELGCASMCEPCYAATYSNRVYAVALWSLPIAANRLQQGRRSLELRRLAIAADAPRNTASRMLAVMARLIKRERLDILRLISYQDTGVHTGAIYRAAGWSAVRRSEFVSWQQHSKRPGRLDQSTAPKVRWELAIRTE